MERGLIILRNYMTDETKWPKGVDDEWMKMTEEKELPPLEKFHQELRNVLDKMKSMGDMKAEEFKGVEELRDEEMRLWDTFKALLIGVRDLDPKGDEFDNYSKIKRINRLSKNFSDALFPPGEVAGTPQVAFLDILRNKHSAVASEVDHLAGAEVADLEKRIPEAQEALKVFFNLFIA